MENRPAGPTHRRPLQKNVQITSTSDTEIELTWTPITYTADTGWYEVSYSEATGVPYESSVQTTDKTANGSHTVTGLTPGIPYYFVVRTHTSAHGTQQNEVISKYTTEVSDSTDNDTTPPSVTNPAASPDPAPKNGCPGDTTVTISADVTDAASGVNYVQLFYRHSSAPTWTVAGNMTNTSGDDDYEKEIGPFDTEGTWQYIIRAYDKRGQQERRAQKSFTVETCAARHDAAICHESRWLHPIPCHRMAAPATRRVTISADVTDAASGVDYVQLFYRHSSAPTWTVAGNMTNTSGDAYEKEIGPFDSAGEWQYIIPGLRQHRQSEGCATILHCRIVCTRHHAAFRHQRFRSA